MRSTEDDCYGKDSSLLTVSERKDMPGYDRATQEASELVRRQREQEENMTRAFIVVSVGKTGGKAR